MEDQLTFIDTATIIREPTPGHIVDLVQKIKSSSHVVILQGAGVSVASGIPDYRGANGIFAYLKEKNMDLTPEEALSLELFRKKPEIYHDLEKRFFLCINAGKQLEPNEGHRLAFHINNLNRLERVLTQNVDGLQVQVLPPEKLIEFHGTRRTAGCINEQISHPYDIEQYKKEVAEGKIPRCERCNALVKTDIVLYGQEINDDNHNEAIAAVKRADLLIIMGTSLEVYPFRSLVDKCKCPIVVMNKVIPKTFPGYLMPRTTFFLYDVEKVCRDVNSLLT